LYNIVSTGLSSIQQWRYALNITAEGEAAKYLCPKPVPPRKWKHRSLPI